ncbi:hypothetical protein BBP40_001146 [Aspergillus hancockii]|nr:hypothetical protein BBP40_001146 [Aspergillus hancockii]
MDPEIQDILSQFKKLKSTTARRAVYYYLLEQMYPHEWRDVRDRMNQLSFQKDILGSLPMEITVQIALYLDMSDIYILRRVSKKWNLLLSSELLRDSVFHRYVGRSCPSIGLRSPGKFRQYAKQTIRLERGQPVYKAHDPPCLPLPRPTGSNGLDFSNGRYAWIEDATIFVHDLHSRTTQSFCTENRDSFNMLRVSEFVVAAITLRGFCHVWSLQTSESAYFRLPSLLCRYFVVRGVGVAMAFNGTMASEKDYIIYWELDSRVARTLQIANELAYLDMDFIAGTMTTVHLEGTVESNAPMHTYTYPIKYTQLRVMKYSLKNAADANWPSSYTIDLATVADPAWHVEIDGALSFAFGNTMGILSARPTGCLTGLPRAIVAITYHAGTDQVRVNTVPAKNTPFIPLCMASVGNNILYYIKNDNGKPKIWISNPDAMNTHRPAKLMDPQLPREASDRVYSYGTNFTLRGDRDFIMMINQNGLKVWCFHENIHLPGAVPL